jgi:NADPH:quinone reductase
VHPKAWPSSTCLPPAPADGQVLITTEAIGVGGVDAVIRRGALAAYGFRQGHIPGGEVAGTVQFAAASRGELHTVVHELLPLEQAVLAHQKMDTGEVFGRIVLTP